VLALHIIIFETKGIDYEDTREVLAAVKTAKSKKRKSFRIQHMDEFTIATIKHIAEMRDQTMAEVIAKAVCAEIAAKPPEGLLTGH
jgi:hypothetical protein